MRIFTFALLYSLMAFTKQPSTASITAAEYIQSRPEIFQPDHPEVLTKLRREVGDDFAQEVMNYFIHEVIVRGQSCDAFIGNCDFYLCQESKNPCGLEGYNLSFGYKYCSRSKFELINKMKTSVGKAWVPKVFQCLQERSLEDSLQINAQAKSRTESCKAIQKKAYASHPDCYVEAGYCELKLIEKSSIIETIFPSIFSFKAAAQGAKIVHLCAKKDRNR